jgi:hypothetical protein
MIVFHLVYLLVNDAAVGLISYPAYPYERSSQSNKQVCQVTICILRWL